MGPDEQARDSLQKSTEVTDAERTERVAAISFADAKRVLGETDKSELDEQPTKKMSALSAADAERMLPPCLELPLATAQYQAIVDKPTPARRIQRGQIAALVLALSFGLGAAAAWLTHDPQGVSSSAPTETRRPPSQLSLGSQAPEATLSEAAMPARADTLSPSVHEPVGEARPSDLTGEEHAETLLEEAESLRGNELRAALEEAASADPTNPHVAAALAEFHMESDPHEALEWALVASRLRRRRASYQDLIADAYERIGNLTDATRARAAALRLREGGD